MKIVLIDDEPEFIKSKFESLTILGHEVVSFMPPKNSVEEILTYIDTYSQSIDLIFIDKNMPANVDGMDLGRKISANKKSETLPLIMLTAYGDEVDYAVKALTECGFDYFIGKDDFTGDEMTVKLEAIEKIPSVNQKRSLKESLLKRKMSWEDYTFDLKNKYSIGETAQMKLRLLYINQIYLASTEPITNQQLNYGYEDFIKSIDQKFDIEIGKIFAPKLKKNQKDENAATWLPKIEAYLDEEFEFNFENWRKIEEKINQDESKKAKPNSISTYFQPIINPKNSEHNKKSRHLLKLLIEDNKDTLRLVKERFDTIENVVRHFKEEIQIY